MKRIMILLLMFILAVATLQVHPAAAADVCAPYKGVKKITWGGQEMKPGQIGRLTVLKNTLLVTFKGDKQVFSRTLKAKEKYRIYNFKPGFVGLGGGYYVKRDSTVLYETPSKERLLALSCLYPASKTPATTATGTPATTTGTQAGPNIGDSGLKPLSASNISEVNALVQEVNLLSSTIYSATQQQIEKSAKSIQAKLDVLKYTQPTAIEPVVQRLKELNQGQVTLFKKKFPENLYIRDMVLDESRGYLYLLDNMNSKLSVLSIKDGSLVKEVKVDHGISMQMDNGKLYIKGPYFTTFDPATLTATSTNLVPGGYVHNDDIYYLYSPYIYGGDYELHDYNIKTKKDITIAVIGDHISNNFAAAFFTMDPGKEILYIADPTNKILKAIDLKTNTLLQTNTVDDIKIENFVWDNGTIFSGGYRIDSSDFTNIIGRYDDTDFFSNPIKGNYVFGVKYIFDRNTFLPIRKMPEEYLGSFFDKMVMDSSNTVYSFNHNNTLTKFKLGIVPVDLPTFTQRDHQLIFEKGVTKWIYDEATNQIFAISEKANKLYYINPDKMSVTREVSIGSAPTDMELYNGSLYIALKGTHRIAVAGTDSNQPITSIKVNVMPDTIELGNNKIFYQHTDQWTRVYAYDMTDGSTTDIFRKMPIPNFSIYGPKLKYDADANILYADSNMNHQLFALDVENYQILQNVDYNQTNNSGEILLDGSTIYHGLYVSPKDDLKQMKVIADQPIVYVGKDSIFTNDGIYDKATWTKQETFTNKINSAYVNGQNEIFTLDEKQTTLIKK